MTAAEQAIESSHQAPGHGDHDIPLPVADADHLRPGVIHYHAQEIAHVLVIEVNAYYAVPSHYLISSFRLFASDLDWNIAILNNFPAREQHEQDFPQNFLAKLAYDESKAKAICFGGGVPWIFVTGRPGCRVRIARMPSAKA